MSTVTIVERHPYWHDDKEVYEQLNTLQLLEEGELVEHDDAVVMLVARLPLPTANAVSSANRLLFAQAFVVCYSEGMLRLTAKNDYTYMLDAAHRFGKSTDHVQHLLGAVERAAAVYIGSATAFDAPLAYIRNSLPTSVAIMWLLSYDARQRLRAESPLRELVSNMVEVAAGDDLVMEFAMHIMKC